MQIPTGDLWSRTRLARITFIVGLILGLFLGWFFHGVISFVVRFFFVLILLVPLAIAIYAWWRLRRQDGRGDIGSATTVISVDTWDSPGRYGQSSRRRRTPEDGPG